MALAVFLAARTIYAICLFLLFFSSPSLLSEQNIFVLAFRMGPSSRPVNKCLKFINFNDF